MQGIAPALIHILRNTRTAGAQTHLLLSPMPGAPAKRPSPSRWAPNLAAGPNRPTQLTCKDASDCRASCFILARHSTSGTSLAATSAAR
jgi:hypothetical protein